MKPVRGMSLIDVIVGTALMLVIFLSLIGLLRVSLLVSSLAKAKAGGTAVANSQMEYIRSLDYDSVGTVGGIPAGAIPQYATTTENSIAYGVRTFIEYVDDPADGTSTADTNGITTDYKRIKVAVTYPFKGATREVDVVSNYAPPSIETSTGGGTLKTIVVNSAGAPVAGATVHVVNASTSPTVDVTTFTDATGVVLLGGAATSTQYQVYVSKSGYSSAQTYARDSNNQNPNPGYLTVVKNQTTANTFAIDSLTNLTLKTLYPIVGSTTLDTFADTSKLASQSNTAVSGGALTLLSGGGSTGYALSGNAKSVTFAPGYLASWTGASTTITTPAGTTAVVHVLDSTGALIPDVALPGNAAGFSASGIPLTTLSTTTYPSIALQANLTTSATTTTSSISDWSVNYRTGPTPVPNVSFTLTGAKTIGTTGAGASIYKTTVSTTTGSTGSNTMILEWDSYLLGLTGYDVIDACDPPPFAMPAGSTDSNSLYLGALTSNSMLVSVRDNASANVAGATATLSKTGFSQAVTTTSCGAAYFGGLASGTYTLVISKSGYTTTTYNSVVISGHTFYLTSFP